MTKRRVTLLCLAFWMLLSGVLGFLDAPPGTASYLIIWGLLVVAFAAVI